MSDDEQLRYRLNQERIRAQESIAQDRIRAQEAIASERGSRSVSLQEQRLAHQRQMQEQQGATKSNIARITGEYDIELAKLEHAQLPERLAIEHEFTMLRSEMEKDELLHEAAVRALFSVVEFAVKTEISGYFEAARDERQFAHALELEKLRQEGTVRTENVTQPSAADLAEWYERISKNRGALA